MAFVDITMFDILCFADMFILDILWIADISDIFMFDRSWVAFILVVPLILPLAFPIFELGDDISVERGPL